MGKFLSFGQNRWNPHRSSTVKKMVESYGSTANSNDRTESSILKNTSSQKLHITLTWSDNIWLEHSWNHRGTIQIKMMFWLDAIYNPGSLFSELTISITHVRWSLESGITKYNSQHIWFSSWRNWKLSYWRNTIFTHLLVYFSEKTKEGISPEIIGMLVAITVIIVILILIFVLIAWRFLCHSSK